MPTFNLFLQHGWGFDQDCWKQWDFSLFKELDIQKKCFEEGYFFQEREDFIQYSPGKNILISHSFGLHLASKKIYEMLDLLVIIGGFISFLPNDPLKRDHTKRALEMMREAIPLDATSVLKKFYEKCSCPWQHKNTQVNEFRLLHDLKMLENSVFDIQLLRKVPKILILHGKKDRIVFLEKAYEMHNQLLKSQLVVLDDGHGLPFTQPQECQKLIRNSLLSLSRVSDDE